MTADETAARAVIDRFWAGWEHLDAAEVLATLSNDDVLTFIGTDRDEYWHGHDAVEGPFRAMTQAFASERVEWWAGDPRIAVSGDIAWASGRLHTIVVLRDGARVEDDVRTTFILRRAIDGWRIVHAHVSVAPAAAVAAY